MIETLHPNVVNVFRSVASEYDSVFSTIIQFLDIGGDKESIRWISKTPNGDYTDPEKLRKLTYGKVSKASPIYEHDTGNRYIVEVNESVFNAMRFPEKQAFAFYLLSHIHIYHTRAGDLRYGIMSSYSANKHTYQHLSENGTSVSLPGPEELANRFAMESNSVR